MVRLVGIALVALGVLALVYGGFTYTRDSHELRLGAVELSLKQKEHVNVPVWFGVGTVAFGVALLLVARK